MGCDCPESQTNFLFVVPPGGADVCKLLEDKGIIVRPMGMFGAPGNAFRVNTGTPDENEAFLEAFEGILSRAG